MKFKILPALSLFIGSYFPLCLILWFRNINEKIWSMSLCKPGQYIKFQNECFFPQPENTLLVYLMLAASLFSLCLLFAFLNKVTSKGEVEIIDVKTIPNDLINYVFPYVVSFMGLDLSKTGEVIGFFIFLIFMFCVSYLSGQILMNPFLLLFKWKLYEITGTISGESKVFKAISKEHLEKNEKIGTRLAEDMYILQKK